MFQREHRRLAPTRQVANAHGAARREPMSPIQCRLTVGRAADPAEREADAVAATVMERLRSGSTSGTERTGAPAASASPRVQRAARAAEHDELGGVTVGGDAADVGDYRLGTGNGVGAPAPGGAAVLRRMAGAFGADFHDVRLHTGRDVDIAAAGLQARAFTVGRDVYIRRNEYRPGTPGGDELIAHELTHTIQQHGSRIRRSTAAPTDVAPVTIRHHIAKRIDGAHVSAKKEKMHLDFIRMKRMDPQYSKIIGKIIGVDLGGAEQSGGTFGHWWTEVGDLDPITNDFDYQHSYGWWPSDLQGSLVNTVVGVDGQLNGGDTQDPHAGEDAPTEFHPVMEVDTAKESYDQIRQRVTQNLDTVAHAYRGKWHWRLGWGKNCHTFQQHLKTKTGIHNQKAKKWLYDPAAQAVALEKQAARQADEERREATRALATQWYDVATPSLTFMDPKTAIERQVESGGKLGPTGNETKDFMGMDCVEVVTWNGDVGWVLAMEFRGWTGQRGT